MFPLTTKGSKYDINPEEASTHLDYLSYLSTQERAPRVKQTKIMCCIGPASEDPGVLEKMMGNGMNIVRLMMGRKSYSTYDRYIRNVRLAVRNYSEKIGRPYPFAIAINLRGAEIKTGKLEAGITDIELRTGETVKLTSDKDYSERCDEKTIYIDYENITKYLHVNDKINLKLGLILLRVTKIRGSTLYCFIEMGGIIRSHASVNLPGTQLDIPHLTQNDKDDINYGIANGVDIIFASYVRNYAGFLEIRDYMGDEGNDLVLIAKVENLQGMDNFASIAKCADGIMVARGDMGAEIAMEKVFLAQKFQVSICNLLGKPTVVGSQLMESMAKHSIPLRSETSDVANAVIDGLDVLSLSTETAKGNFPVESVETMTKTCVAAECAVWRKQVYHDMAEKVVPPVEAPQAIAICAVLAAIKTSAAAIIVTTRTGRSAHFIAKYRPRCPIIAVTRNPIKCRQLCLYKGIIPLLYPTDKGPFWLKDMDDRVQAGLKLGQKEGFVKVADAIIVVTGWKQGLGYTNTMRIIYVPSVIQTILY